MAASPLFHVVFHRLGQEGSTPAVGFPTCPIQIPEKVSGNEVSCLKGKLAVESAVPKKTWLWKGPVSDIAQLVR